MLFGLIYTLHLSYPNELKLFSPQCDITCLPAELIKIAKISALSGYAVLHFLHASAAVTSTEGTFPLQISAKRGQNCINVDKKVLRNDGFFINQCYPFASRDKSWQRILVGF